MAPPRGSAAYKKKDGTLALSKDGQSLCWTPVAPPGSSPTFTLGVSAITNLQQTPATNPKVMLRVFAQPPDASEPEIHLFSFTSPTAARAEADALRDALSKAIQAIKSAAILPVSNGGGGGASAAMAIASAVSSLPGAGPGADINAWFDDSQLKSDVELQQSLLKANPSLQKTFMESLRTKPDSITNTQFTSQFWASRIHLLRAHAIEKSQKRGAYNVLSTIKPKTVDNATRLSISKEQIQLIFSQHSLVKQVYDENVPKLSEESFWSRFFQSRLFKKLKGEKFSESDPTDPVLDKYLSYDEDAERAKRLMASHVPNIINIEGNEENHSQRKGNQPDLTMRPTSSDKVPIIRTLNTLSEKIMAHVAPNDVDPSEPIGMDEETYNSLALHDLQGDAEESRIILNIKDQSRFFSADNENGVSADALLYAKQDPNQVLRSLRAELVTASADPNLESVIGVNPDSDSEDDENSSKPHVGSKPSLSAATAQILAAIVEQRAQQDDSSTATSASTGLSPPIFDRLSLTHATTTEFLHHFWLAFLSGSPFRAGEIASLVETLNRAMDRIKAVGNDAEAERGKELEKLKKQVGGGRKVVEQLLAPTVNAIGVAVGEYSKALREAEEGEGGPT
ncbi:rna polymerase ii transcription factor related protein [Lasallia pustulata]|uniref:Rna polymerase ii transcription factor related protein n=1 Tax=Lasallia pustulata TaxID=136370 RepID=A0A1W5CYJ0_9LECA|nr:rna polymerase ii transcription factor related protein [Lasallia pustulata]